MPPDVTTTQRPSGRRRPGLTVEEISRAALDVVDEEGFGSLSVRSVAGRLGVVPSALYKHLPDMDALVDAVMELVLGEIDFEVPDEEPWRVRAETLAGRLRAGLQARPGVAAVLKGRDPLGPNSDRLADAFARCVLDAGLTGDGAGHAWYTLVHFVIGFEATFSAATGNLERAYDPAALARIHAHFDEVDPDERPGLAILGRHIWAPQLDERFLAGLAIVLDGIERRA